MLSAGSFASMGSTVTVVVDGGADTLGDALDVVRAQLDEIDRICSRFREDSELCHLNRQAGEAPVKVSPLLEEAVAVALESARMTGGLVDPTVGRSLEILGYTVTFRDLPRDGPPRDLTVQPAPGWHVVEHDPEEHTVRLPAGVTLDLGASGKAWAADRAAAAAALHVDCGVAVDCGGDVAVSGRPPERGWPVRVSEGPNAPVWQDVHVFDGGLASSGTRVRAWRRGGLDIHHIIDPSTGLPAETPWRMASVAAASCVEANAAATTAIILGDAATDWLDGLGLPARLVDRAGRIHCAGLWPRES